MPLLIQKIIEIDETTCYRNSNQAYYTDHLNSNQFHRHRFSNFLMMRILVLPWSILSVDFHKLPLFSAIVSNHLDIDIDT
jgi:hypothetical protein